MLKRQMRLYYFEGSRPNFGDALNPWMWPRLLPDLIKPCPVLTRRRGDGYATASDTLLIGIGTLLNENVPDAPQKITFGAGVGYGTGCPVIDDRWQIYAVRGPLSATALGLPLTAAVTDPAALLRFIELPEPEVRYDATFMPHWETNGAPAWEAICAATGVNYIDPSAPVQRTIEEIRASRLVIAEAMHAAVVADAFRIPWIAVQTAPHVLEFKWHDWCKSLSIEYSPVRLPTLWQPEGSGVLASARQEFKLRWAERAMSVLLRNPVPQLSKDRVLNAALDRYAELLTQLKAARECSDLL